MKIGIDARFLTHPQPGGFKTYTENLVTALAEVDAANEYVLYLDRAPGQDVQLPDRANFTTSIVPGSVPVLGMLWREQLGLSRRAVCDGLDLLHSPSLTAPLHLACTSVVTIYDMIWYFPERFSKGKPFSGKRKLMEWYYRSVPKIAARQAAAVITVSYASKESLVQHLGLPSERVFVTYAAASRTYRHVDDREPIEALRRKHNLTSDFILAIGSADPRKNITALVRAYALLPASLQERYQLIIVWTHSLLASDLREQVRVWGINDRVKFLRRVSDHELAVLYNAASLFVFPSLYEGFGLPLLEAMACGTPVVAANSSSIPEIVGNAASLADPRNIDDMAGVIAQVLTDEKLQTLLIQKGLDRAASFSWEKCARETVAVYRNAVS